MEDVLQTRKQHRHAHKRALWFMSILLILIVCVAAGASFRAIRSGEESILSDIERPMFSAARNRAEELTVWYGALSSQSARLANSDLLRLFASEVKNTGNDISRLKELARKATPLRSSAESSDTVARLAGQMPLMQSFLREFVMQTGILSARLLNAGAQEYLSSDEHAPPLPPDQIHRIFETLKHNQGCILPVVRNAEGRLILNIVEPVFAPSYVAAPDSDAVAALVLSCDISNILRKTAPAPRQEEYTALILQQALSGGLEVIPADGQSTIAIFPGWSPTETGALAPAVRDLPKNAAGITEKVFSLGAAVQGLPWIAAEYIPQQIVERRFAENRRYVIFTAAAATIIAALALGIIWWWLVGRRERSIAAELHDLYQTVNRQKELLDGINSALADGITLQDATGAIVYANPAFAAMVGKTPENILGRNCEEIFGLQNSQICRTAAEVIRLGTAVAFTECLHIHNEKRHYQIACSPFHNEDGAPTGVVSVYRDITQLIKTQERTQNMISQTVNVLVRAIETVDPYLRGQSAQTGQLAVCLARRMGLGLEHENTLRTAANLSQIGMIQLPPHLLKKAGELTPEERAQMERHVEYAGAVLKDIDFGLPVLDAICQMHERLDGSGYPNHLQGGKIGMDGRILAIANTFCALVRPRSYRKARSVENALDILSKTPPQYDPAIVKELKEFLDTPQGREFLENLCCE